jgi:cold shock CspA family protein
MLTGSICKWFPDRFFGFIRRDDGERDIFFHRRTVAAHDAEIVEGRRVSFEVIADFGDRDKAVAVRFLDKQV